MSSTPAVDISELEAEIVAQTAKFNELRLKGEPLDEIKKSLSDLKKKLALAKNAGKEKKEKVAGDKAKAEGSGAQQGQEKKKERLLLKTAKVRHVVVLNVLFLDFFLHLHQGTRDYGAAEMFCREHITQVIKDCFTTYGAACLDTPVFERKDVLTDKYGEDAKLIFDLMDQGGEQLALRYDHTVPLARYLAMSGGTTPQNKIWQIGKVYRRDNPVMSKGRMREFMQAVSLIRCL